MTWIHRQEFGRRRKSYNEDAAFGKMPVWCGFSGHRRLGIMAGQWSLKLARAGWMWGLSLGAGFVIAGLGIAIAVIGATHSSNYGRPANTWVLFSVGIALLGILMILVVQWAMPVTGLGICYYWRSSVDIGSFAFRCTRHCSGSSWQAAVGIAMGA